MHIQNINPQNFEAKNFRLPIFVDSKLYLREYENPNAKKIYREARKIENPFECGKKLSEMGHYKLMIFNPIERLKMFFDKITMDFLW